MSDDDSVNIEIGSQSGGDSPFQARMRLHQSWFRANVLQVPCGTGPTKGSTRHYGNMLRPEDGDRGLNSLSQEIFETVQRRLAAPQGGVERFRCLHNMLSSQPMCFNLFGPMVTDHELATRTFQRVLSNEVQRVTRVAIEYAPEPAAEYLDDRTSFDAFVEFDRPDGRRGFIGIETKLTEPFSRKKYDTATYRRLAEQADSPWPESAWPRLADVEHNQLWRNHLLAVAMLRHAESPYASGFFMLVAHPDDEPCWSAAATYRALIKPEDRSYIEYPLNRLVDVIGSVASGTPDQDWFANLKNRYLDLSLSERAWQDHIAGQAS